MYNCARWLNVLMLPVLLMMFQAVSAQPVVVTQPHDTSVCVESSAGFSIIAVNTSGYQWQENDGVGWYNLDASVTYVEGEYTPNLTINDANLALNGYQYRCVVNDIYNDKDTSLPAILGVYEPPIITSNPVNQIVCKSETALFSVVAINGSHYQWQEYNSVGWLDIEDNSFYEGAQTSALSVYTVVGMDGFLFRCVVKNISCPDTSGNAVLNVDPTPIIYGVTGGGEYCEGDEGVIIGLSSSEMGITYNLLRNGVETGIVEEGTGQVIDFGLQLLDGTYTVVGYNQFTSCSIVMSGEATVIVNKAPVSYSLFGGGSYCENTIGVEILLDGSDEAVNYELFNNTGSTGVIVPGSNYTLSFGLHNYEGYYWAVAYADNGCISTMKDSVQVTIIESPIAYAGQDQHIDKGTVVQFGGIATGGSGFYNYNWFPDYLLVNPVVQNPVTATLNESTLFMLIVDDANTGCISNTDTVVVYVINTQLTVAVNAAPTRLCEGGEVHLTALPGGGTGNYSYKWHSNPPGFYSNVQFPVDLPSESTTYIVEVDDGDAIVTGSVLVEVIPSPEVFDLHGGGSYCINGNDVNITLSGSEEFVEYTLFKDQNIEVITLIGDGLPIDFGEFKTEGSFTVMAGNPDARCLKQMAGSVEVDQHPQPIADAGLDITISSGSQATLNGSASGGLGIYSYLWMPVEKLLNPTDPDATTVTLIATTLFSLQVTDDTSGCQSSSSNMIVFVSGGPLVVDVYVNNNLVCSGEQITIYALPGGGNGNYSYVWESIPPGFNSNLPQITVSPVEPTWYKVTVSDGNEVVSDSVLMNPLPLPEPYDLLGGGGYCRGSDGVDVYLESSSLSTIYTLFNNTVPTGQYIQGTGTRISFENIMAEGNYSVMAQNESGCSLLMNNIVQVNSYSLPVKFQLFGGGTYCENDPTLGVMLESSELNVDYELYNDAVPTGIVKHGSGLPLGFTNFSGTGNYSVVATGTETGCTNSMNGVAGLIIHDTPDIIISGKNNLCLGDSIILSGLGGHTFEWNTIPPQYTSSITVLPIVATSYTLTGYNLNTCSDTATHIVEVNDNPDISVIDDPLLLSVICYPDNLFNYDFYFGDVLIQEGSLNSWYYGDIGMISDTIVVIAKNESGCMDEGRIKVEMKEPPNAFTPDGDGINDIFLKGYEITVYSSWGGEVYKGNTGWDGKHNGTLVVPGTYYYVHHIHNTDGAIIKTIKGSVTVVIK